MEAVECPHCGKPIELVGARELKDDFGLGPNSVQHARDRGKFPEPWLSFGNRNIFLKDVIATYVENRSRQTVEDSVQQLLTSLDHLPEAERAKAKKLLEEKLNGSPRRAPRRK